MFLYTILHVYLPSLILHSTVQQTCDRCFVARTAVHFVVTREYFEVTHGESVRANRSALPVRAVELFVVRFHCWLQTITHCQALFAAHSCSCILQHHFHVAF